MDLHKSVLMQEVLTSLSIKPGDEILDCTAGAGGHTTSFLELTGSNGRVVSMDQDPVALNIINEKLLSFIQTKNLVVIHGNFSRLKYYLDSNQETHNSHFDAIFADIGVSSMQLDTPGRGFSFQQDGPLDMRMGTISSGLEYETAYDLINFAPEELLSKIFWNYGEEQSARRYAKKICEARTLKPFNSTTEFANFIKDSGAYKGHSKKHPATKVFQAIRIYINGELTALESLIKEAVDLLKPGGRLGIITFHSLEDRIVKELYLELSGKNALKSYPREIPVTHLEQQAKIASKGHILKPFPMTPTQLEITSNPRSRSAKLRVFIKSH
jgi:16S rRNA (cytosine1402-N4)-methyltransferase